jgi:hypothetical protein
MSQNNGSVEHRSLAGCQASRDSIECVASVIAGGAFLAVALCLVFYGIDMKLNPTISHDLNERRKDYESVAWRSLNNSLSKKCRELEL